MKSSVIIPTFNRKDILSKVLKEFVKQDKSDNNYEIIVIDDGSTDDTAKLFSSINKLDYSNYNISENHEKLITEVKKGLLNDIVDEKSFLVNPKVKYIRIKKSGRSVARNIGIELSEGDLIIFSDDDIFVEREYIYKHVSYHHFNDKLVVMGKVINTTDLNNPFSTKWKLQDINTAFLATGNASVLKNYIIEAGGFDENYKIYGWEDFDLGIHLKNIGLKSIKKPVYGYHYNPVSEYIDPITLYHKEKERGITAVYFYINHPLPWVKRFTLIDSKIISKMVFLFASKMVKKYLSRNKIKLKGVKRLLFRYVAYFDGLKEGKELYEK